MAVEPFTFSKPSFYTDIFDGIARSVAQAEPPPVNTLPPPPPRTVTYDPDMEAINAAERARQKAYAESQTRGTIEFERPQTSDPIFDQTLTNGGYLDVPDANSVYDTQDQMRKRQGAMAEAEFALELSRAKADFIKQRQARALQIFNTPGAFDDTEAIYSRDNPSDLSGIFSAASQIGLAVAAHKNPERARRLVPVLEALERMGKSASSGGGGGGSRSARSRNVSELSRIQAEINAYNQIFPGDGGVAPEILERQLEALRDTSPEQEYAENLRKARMVGASDAILNRQKREEEIESENLGQSLDLFREIQNAREQQGTRDHDLLKAIFGQAAQNRRADVNNQQGTEHFNIKEINDVKNPGSRAGTPKQTTPEYDAAVRIIKTWAPGRKDANNNPVPKPAGYDDAAAFINQFDRTAMRGGPFVPPKDQPKSSGSGTDRRKQMGVEGKRRRGVASQLTDAEKAAFARAMSSKAVSGPDPAAIMRGVQTAPAASLDREQLIQRIMQKKSISRSSAESAADAILKR